MHVASRRLADVEPNPAFCYFVAEFCGGSKSEAARRLEMDHSQAWRMAKGTRAVQPGLAKRIEELTEGKVKRGWLVWPETVPASIRRRVERRRA